MTIGNGGRGTGDEAVTITTLHAQASHSDSFSFQLRVLSNEKQNQSVKQWASGKW